MSEYTKTQVQIGHRAPHAIHTTDDHGDPAIRSGCCGQRITRSVPGSGSWECMNCGTEQD